MKFYNTAIEIDRLSELEIVTDKNLAKLNNLLSSIALKIYFYRNLKNHLWFQPLLNSNEFVEIYQLNSDISENYILQLEVSVYILRIAENKTYQKEITSLIKTTIVNNSRVYWRFIQIAVKLDSRYTAKLVPSINIWIKEKLLGREIIASDLSKWFSHLIDGDQSEPALLLLRIISTPQEQKPIEKRGKEIEEIMGKAHPTATPVMESYWFKEIIDKGTKLLIHKDSIEVTKILAKSLNKAIYIEYKHIDPPGDFSTMWRPAIEEHSQNSGLGDMKDVLLVALRDALEMAVQKNWKESKAIVESFVKDKYSIFKRLAIHSYRIIYNENKAPAKKFLRKTTLLTQPYISHEYFLLLDKVYPDLNDSLQQSIIKRIKSSAWHEKKASLDLQEQQKRRYVYGKLYFISEHLKGEDKKNYFRLKKEFSKAKIKDTAFHFETYYGETSPIKLEKLERKSYRKIFDFLRDYNPFEKGFDAPTKDGLAGVFSQVVKKQPERFLNKDLTPFLDLSLTYNYWLVNAIDDLWKNGKFFDIKKILVFLTRLMKVENQPVHYLGERGINSKDVKNRILDVLDTVVSKNQKTFSIEHKNIIWDIIEYLAYYEDDPTDSPGKTNSTLEPLTLALNSIRSIALHNTVNYGLWIAFHTKEEHQNLDIPNRLKGEERVFQLLENKLDKNIDKSLAVHSTYGVYLQNLAYLNFNWVKDNVEKIFPKSSPYWEVAWTGYISYSRLYNALYETLKPQYQRALDYIEKGESVSSENYGRKPEEALSEHLIIASIRGLDNIFQRNSLLKRFAQFADSEFISHAVLYISNLAKDERIFHDKELNFWPQAKRFWEIRINIAKNAVREISKSVHDEDKYEHEFSTYYRWLPSLPETISFIEVAPLLKKSIDINKKGWDLPQLIKYLAENSKKYSHEVIKLFYYQNKTDAPNHFYHGAEDDIVEILTNALESSNPKSKSLAEKIINRFGEWGNYKYKDLWVKYFYINEKS
jgi:hypothetical protein